MDAIYFMVGFAFLTGLGLFAVLVGRGMYRLVKSEYQLFRNRLALAKQTPSVSKDADTDSSESNNETVIVESEKVVIFPGARDWSKYERPTCLDDERMEAFQSRKVDRELRREFELLDAEEA